MVPTTGEKSETKSLAKPKRDIDERILTSFYSLSNPLRSTRLQAAGIITDVIQNQKNVERERSLQYCVDRVVKGLSSSRQSSRRGFAVLLSQLLSESNDLKLEEIMKLAEKYHGTPQTATAEQAIALSLLYSSILSSFESPEITPILRRILRNLYELGKRKRYLELLVCNLLSAVMKNGQLKKLPEHLWSYVKEETDGFKIDEITRLDLFILLVVGRTKSHFQEEITTIMKKALKGKLVEKAFTESTEFMPNLHPVCVELIEFYKNDKKFKAFWTNTVENALFKTNQRTKIAMGFNVISSTIQNIQAHHISLVITSTFIEHLTQALRNRKHVLHTSAKNVLDTVATAVAKNQDPSYQFQVASHFLENSTSFVIKTLSRHKFISRLVTVFNKEALDHWLSFLKKKLTEINEVDEKDTVRCALAVQLGDIFHSTCLKDDLKMKTEITKMFIFYSYFVNTNTTGDDFALKVPITKSLRTQFQQELNKALETVCMQQIRLSKFCKLDDDAMYTLAVYANQLFKANTPSILDEAVMKEWMNKFADFVKTKSLTTEKHLQPFMCLYSLFALYTLDNLEESSNILTELNECINRATKRNKSESKSSSEPVWADVMLDLIISLLPAATVLMRKILIVAFKCIRSHVTAVGLEQLCSALRSSLSKDVDDVSTEDEMQLDENEEESESEGSEDESEDDEELEDPDEDFKMKLINALGPAGQQGEDDESDANVSDSEMMLLDEALAEVFRSKVNPSKAAKRNQLDKIEFAIRCLDLVNVFLGTENIQLDNTLFVIRTLIILAKHSGKKIAKQQADKVAASLTEAAKIKAFASTDNQKDEQALRSTLTAAIETYNQAQDIVVRQSFASLICWLVTVAKKLNSEATWYIEPIMNILQGKQHRNQIVPDEVFTELVKLHLEFCLPTIQCIETRIFEPTLREFHKTKYLRILSAALRSLSADSVENIQKNVESMSEKLSEAFCEAMKTDKGTYIAELALCLATSAQKFNLPDGIKKDLGLSLQDVARKNKRKLTKEGKRSLNKLKRLCINEKPKTNNESATE